MAAAVISPSLPDIYKDFSGISNAKLLVQLILTVPSIFIAVLAPAAGLIIDKTGRKPVLLFSSLLYAISGTTGLYLNNIYLILAGRALLGISVAGIMTTVTTLIADYYYKKQRRKFMGLMGAFMSFGGVVFFSVGGILSDISWRTPFWIYSIAILLFLMVLMFIYEPEVKKHKTQKPFSFQFLKEINFPKLCVIYLIVFLGFVFFFIIIVQVPFVLKTFGDISNTKTGYSISLSILTSALVSICYSRIKKYLSFSLVYVFSFLLMSAGFIVIYFSGIYTSFLTGLIIFGAGMGLLMPNSNLWVVTLAPENLRGRLVGILSTFLYTGQFLSPILVSPFNKHFDINTAFGISGIIMLLLCFFFLFYHFRIQKQHCK